MKPKTYNITDVGNIEISKHHNSQKISIKLRQNCLPKVIIPKLMTYDMGYRFAIEKKQWIIKHSKQLNQKQNITIYDENNDISTQYHNISIKSHDDYSIKTLKKNNKINILVPQTEIVKSDKIQNEIKKILIEIFRFEAKLKLIPRVEELANIYGFKYNKVFIKNLKSRWGSCSAQNNINLNLHLVRMPEYLSDFIILHELCHTIHKNHGVHFHELLNKIVGKEKLLDKELKKYRTQL